MSSSRYARGTTVAREAVGRVCRRRRQVPVIPGRLPSRRAGHRLLGLRPTARSTSSPIGNALVDVLASAKDEDLAALGLVKGTMALVDRERSESIYATMGPTTEASGGSAANTAAGIAALGGRAAFLGRVADDGLGRAFTHDIRSIGVAFEPTPAPAAGGESVTGHCLVLVTRRRRAHHGHPPRGGVRLRRRRPARRPSERRARSSTSRATSGSRSRPSPPCARRSRSPTPSDAAVALSLSDPFCVEHHRAEFLELLKGDLEMLFANEEEIVLLFGARRLRCGGPGGRGDRRARRAHPGRRRLGGGDRRRARSRCPPHRSTGSSTPPERATCSPPGSSTGSPTGSTPPSAPGWGVCARPRSSPTSAPVLSPISARWPVRPGWSYERCGCSVGGCARTRPSYCRSRQVSTS